MKLIFTVMILLFMIPVFTLEITNDLGEIILFEKTNLADFTLVNLTITNEKRHETVIEQYSGFRLTNLMTKFGLLNFSAIEFIASDQYLVRLTREQIIEYDPLIAIMKDDNLLPLEGLRLISPDLPNMYKISNIEKIISVLDIFITEPAIIFPVHTILERVKLSINSEQEQVFQMAEIIAQLSTKNEITIRLASTDGMEQVLPAHYLKNASLVKNQNLFHLQGPEIPRGMRQKELLFMAVEENYILFYQHQNLQQNEEYIKFMKVISNKPRKAMINGEIKEIADFDIFDWSTVNYVE